LGDQSFGEVLAQGANRRELYRIRIENINWQTRSIFLPDSKTPEGKENRPDERRSFRNFTSSLP
jgi:hypothetical protein